MYISAVTSLETVPPAQRPLQPNKPGTRPLHTGKPKVSGEAVSLGPHVTLEVSSDTQCLAIDAIGS